jgi:hypothetical protein
MQFLYKNSSANYFSNLVQIIRVQILFQILQKFIPLNNPLRSQGYVSGSAAPESAEPAAAASPAADSAAADEAFLAAVVAVAAGTLKLWHEIGEMYSRN